MSLLKSSSVRIGVRKPTATQPKKPTRSFAVRKGEEEAPVVRPKATRPPVSEERAVVPASNLLEEERPAFLTKTQYKKVISAFGISAPTIIKMLDRSDNDGALTAINRTLMQTLIDILPVLENNVRLSKGQRGVYQFNQVIAQMRELAADIQALQDKGMVGARVVERFVKPMFQDIAIQISIGYTTIREEARAHMDKEEFAEFNQNTMTRLQAGLADYLTKRYEEVCKDIAQAFS